MCVEQECSKIGYINISILNIGRLIRIPEPRNVLFVEMLLKVLHSGRFSMCEDKDGVAQLLWDGKDDTITTEKVEKRNSEKFGNGDDKQGIDEIDEWFKDLDRKNDKDDEISKLLDSVEMNDDESLWSYYMKLKNVMITRVAMKDEQLFETGMGSMMRDGETYNEIDW
jgi:hypothetical protein